MTTDTVHQFAPYVPDPALPPAWVFDVDGTLALMQGRRDPYDYTRVGEDAPHGPVVDVCRALAATGVEIVVMSGRDDSCREATWAWLKKHGIPVAALHMRVTGDHRPDDIVKSDLFDEMVAPTWNVRGVVDDRAKVVRMWRTRGLVCLQAAPGDF